MNAPTLDTLTVTTTPAVSTVQPAVVVRDEVSAADLLTFQIGMGVLLAVLLVMTVVGAVIASAPMLIGAGLFTVLVALVNAATDVTLVAR